MVPDVALTPHQGAGAALVLGVGVLQVLGTVSCWPEPPDTGQGLGRDMAMS